MSLSRRIIIFLCSVLYLNFSATAFVCAQTESASLQKGLSRVLVVYYSRDGHTKQVALALAKRFNADIEQLVDTKKRTGFIGFSAAGKDAIAKHTTRLEPLAHDIEQYDVVLIGTPSWFGNITPAVRTFVKEHDLTKKKIGVFATAHMTGVENALKQLVALLQTDPPRYIPQLPFRHAELQQPALSEKIEVFYLDMRST